MLMVFIAGMGGPCWILFPSILRENVVELRIMPEWWWALDEIQILLIVLHDVSVELDVIII